jgi:nucleoside recognition membrane protein YjiH
MGKFVVLSWINVIGNVSGVCDHSNTWGFLLFFVSFLVEQGFSLSTSHLQIGHSTTLSHLQPILLWLFWRWSFAIYFLVLAWNKDPLDLSLPSS